MKSRNLYSIAMACMLLLLSMANVRAQEGEAAKYRITRPKQPSDVPDFQVSLYNTASEFRDLSRLNLRLQFNNEALQFITSKDKKFKADFEVSVVLLTADSVEVERTQWTGTVYAKDFEATTSKKIYHSNQGFIEAQPGEYAIKIGFRDLETRRTGYRTGSVQLRDFSGDQLMISDVWFADSTYGSGDFTNGQLDSLSQPAPVPAFFEIYNAEDSIKVEFRVFDGSQDSVFAKQERIASTGRITQHSVELPAGVLAEQSGSVNIYAQTSSDSVEYQQPLFYFADQPRPTFTNLSDAIDKLEYIAKDDVLKKIREATGEEQVRLFKEFWQERDPTPETDENEYFEEYYRRIDRANQLFKDQGAMGWKTDMGHVYVMLGPPDDIQAYRSNRDFYSPSFTRSSTLVWEYYQLRRRAIFDNRFGEYRLSNYSELFDLLTGEMTF